MRIIVTIIILCFLQKTAFSHVDTLVINNIKFISIKSTATSAVGSKDTLLKLYRLEGGKKKYLLTHNLFFKDADCDNVFTDVGSISVNKDSIIFLTHYLQSKKKRPDPIPEWRKQIYRVSGTGKLSLIYDKSKKKGEAWVKTD
jgi:WD40 repeat protein